MYKRQTEDSHKLVETELDYFLVDPLDGTRSCKRYLFLGSSEVGFGPLVGCVKGGELVASSYFSVPHSTLFTAIKGQGTKRLVVKDFKSKITDFDSREKLFIHNAKPLNESAILFYFGKQGESDYIMKLLHGRERNVCLLYTSPSPRD